METTAPSPAMPKGNNQDSTAGRLAKGAAAMHHVIDKAADTVVNKIAAGAHRGVDKVAGAAAPAAGWLGDAAGKLKQTRQTLLDGGCAYIRARPLTYVGVALALGFLVGRLKR